MAVEAVAEFEPSIRDVFTAIAAMSRTMVVRDEIKADVAETLLPIYTRLDSFDAGIAKLGDQTRNLNARVVRLESDAAQEADRMSRIESEIQKLEAKFSEMKTAAIPNRGIKQ